MSEGVISVVVVDDHPAIVAGIEAWYAAADPPFDVVATGPTPAVAWTAPGDSADVIVLDLQLSSGTPVYNDLRRLAESGRTVIVYTMRDEPEVALRCLDLGAYTCLTKAEGREHLVAATRHAAAHLPYCPPSLAGAMGTDRNPDRPKLAPREVDVLLDWFHSESKELVARRLNLSVRTVNSYLDRVRIKYANAGRPAPTKAVLVARAIQDGLVSLDEL